MCNTYLDRGESNRKGGYRHPLACIPLQVPFYYYAYRILGNLRFLAWNDGVVVVAHMQRL
jgi:hypothetical protein